MAEKKLPQKLIQRSYIQLLTVVDIPSNGANNRFDKKCISFFKKLPLQIQTAGSVSRLILSQTRHHWGMQTQSSLVSDFLSCTFLSELKSLLVTFLSFKLYFGWNASHYRNHCTYFWTWDLTPIICFSQNSFMLKCKFERWQKIVLLLCKMEGVTDQSLW